MTDSDSANAGWGPLSSLPGNPLMWVLIGSELLVFGAGLIAFSAARIAEPAVFASSQDSLDRGLATLNTAVLVTSGYCAAQAVIAGREASTKRPRLWLLGAGLLGLLFLAIKLLEYRAKLEAGVGLETNTFFTLYYLLTGFHLAHVIFGLGILALVAWLPRPENLETGAAFWHMVDLVWVLIFPVIYLVR